MADNSLRTPGSGETIASDDIGGVKHQRVKISLGADGVAQDMVGNTEGVLLASAARTVQTISANQTNHNARGVFITLNATVNPGGGRTLTIDVQFIDPISGTALSLVTFTASASSNQGVFIYPGIPTAAATTFNLPLPRTWRAVVTPSDAASWTYSLGYALIV